MKLIFLGPPGAGKGTHAKRLSEQLGLAHLAAGDCLRKQIAGGTALGLQAKDIIQRGELVPDDLVNRMMEEEMAGAMKEYRGFILDGYPRTMNQAEALDLFCAQKNVAIDAAVNFRTSEQVIVERLGGRLICGSCGANYHRTNIPPRQEGLCDRCGKVLTQRKDDNPETIKNRLAVYRKETAPLIDFYREKRILNEFDGDQPLEALCAQLLTFFESLNKTLR